jgi:putative drug exporter of the RND superfamily
MSHVFYRFGACVGRHPRGVLAAWAIAIALGVWGAGEFELAAQNGTSGLYGSPSNDVAETLRSDFNVPFLEPLVVAFSSPMFSIDDAALLAWDRDAARTLRGLASVKRVAAYSDSGDPHLRAPNGHQGLLLVELAAIDVPGQQRAVPLVRAALAPLRAQLTALDPKARLAVTGGPAADYDINTSSAQGGDRAEKRALPLTLAILILAFGTLLAAALPFLMGLATTTVSLGLAFMLARLMPVSNLLGNVVTMIGLAIGIDYSLLVVKDYRERLRHSPVLEAVAQTVAEAGTTILWSGSTVAIGLLGLLFSPILETRSVGIGGALVVLVSVLAAVTLLPACLALLGNRIERWPLPRRSAAAPGGKSAWARLAEWIVRRPLRTLAVSAGAVMANLLAVAAGYGAVVAIFQFGWLHGLVGLERPFSSIPLEVPLMIFCLSFGLSMDYELFLLFRIQRQFALHRDNDRATAEGLAAVGPVITGAGLIMTVVFGAFVSADLPALKMIGVGLCVAVLVDASVIRAFVVPAFMSIAGRWNWYPGDSQGPRTGARKGI